MEKIINFFKNSQLSQYFLSGLIVVLVITNVVTIVILQKNSSQIKKLSNNNIKVIDNSDQNTNQDGLSNINQDEQYEEPENVEIVKDNTTGEITAEWYDLPYKVSASDIFTKTLKISDTDFKNKIRDAGNLTAYKVGSVKQGPYQDKEIILLYCDETEGLGCRSFYRVIQGDDKLVVLGKYSDEWLDTFNGLVVLNQNISFSNLETPQTISIPNSSYDLVKVMERYFDLLLMQDLTGQPDKLFKYNGVDYVYWNGDYYFVKAGDGTIQKYQIDLKFLGNQGQSSQYHGTVPNVLEFNWLDGTKNQNEYLSIGDYYYRSLYNYVDYVTNVSLLNKVGQDNNGNIFYELKQNVKVTSDNYEFQPLQNMYEQYYPGYDESTQKEKTKITFVDFLKTHPIIYWQDPFGKFIEFKDAKYLPAAEMGKPVIYLYPEKEIQVSVEVSPTGGFTKTEPAYNNGWNVSAKPNGEIYNYADKKTYPYLFWEGIGLNYERPKEGFVVKKEDIKDFLESKLAQTGLIKNEYDEFISFWLPKMQADPYYFITFVPQEQFNLLAPLKVLPQPDTVIRVFMDYQGLTLPIKVKPQIIRTPIRKGFSVVEWGGQLRH